MSDRYIDDFPDRPGSLWDRIADTFRVSPRTEKQTALAERRTAPAARTDIPQGRTYSNDVHQAEHVRKTREYHQISEDNPTPVDQYIHRMSANREPARIRMEEVMPMDDGEEIMPVDDAFVQVHSTHISIIDEAITDTILPDMPEQNAAQFSSFESDRTRRSREFHEIFSQGEIHDEVDEFLSRDKDTSLESDRTEFFPEMHDSFSRNKDDGPVRVRPAPIGTPGEAIPDAVSFGIQKPGHGARNQFPGRQFPGRQAPPNRDFSPPPNPPKNRDRESRKWIPSSQTVTIAGREINGLIYMGPADITPHMAVADRGIDKKVKSMPYWPKYRNISSQARATYLDWLAGERSDPDYEPGYMFLYFYGLEQRFLCDIPPPAEKREILEEVKRLKNIYPGNNSVQKYLGEFIQLAQFLLNEKIIQEPSTTHRNPELPLWLKVEIGIQVGRGLPLSAEQMFHWMMYHPERRLLAPAIRCPEEFRVLFETDFRNQFPDGLRVEIPHAELEYTYKAASGDFDWVFENKPGQPRIEDISCLTRPLARVQAIANHVMDTLENYSRYIARNPGKKGSVEAHFLLPSQLREIFPCKELERLKAWVDNVIDKGGPVSVLDAIEHIEGTRPEKPAKRNLTRMADLLGKIDCGFAPDPRFGLRAPKSDEPVILFNFEKTKRHPWKVSEPYRTTLLKSALGAFVAHADGRITESERKSILVMSREADGLTSQDQCHLAANIQWMLAVPPELTLLKRKLKEAGPDTLASLCTAMITVAHADGVVQTEEVTAIEKIYKAMGLETSRVYSDLHAGEASGAPATGSAGQVGTKGAGATELDTAKIAAIQSDTARASSMLGDIFDETPENSPKDPREDSPKTETGTGTACPHGLDAEHWQLVQALIAREHWTEEEFGELCNKAGFMVSAAVEDINEWAYETYDDPLIEEYDGYEILLGPAGKLKKQIEGDDPSIEP